MTETVSDQAKPSIAYVDESEDERKNFHLDAYASELFSEIHTLHPDDDLNTLISRLLDLRVDALVSDFRLTDAGPKTYTGADVVAGFLEVRKDFPCFIRTSYDDDAMISSTDVNLVYSKDVKDEAAAGRDLFRRVALQITNHKARVEGWLEEFNVLAAKDPATRTAADIERLVELDDDLERSFSNDQVIAKSVKRQAIERSGLLARQDELIDQTEKLIASIKKALG